MEKFENSSISGEVTMKENGSVRCVKNLTAFLTQSLDSSLSL